MSRFAKRAADRALTGLPPIPEATRAGSAITDTIEIADSPARELRAIASKLEALADNIEGEGAIDEHQLLLALRERDQLLLRVWAEAELRGRQKRREFIPETLLGEPAWDILLDLYVRNAMRRPAPANSLCHEASGCDSTAERALRALEQDGLVEQKASAQDDDVQIVKLTDRGLQAVSRWLRYRAAMLA